MLCMQCALWLCMKLCMWRGWYTGIAWVSSCHLDLSRQPTPHLLDPHLPPQVPSPFRPTIKSIESCENFDKMYTDLAPTVSGTVLLCPACVGWVAGWLGVGYTRNTDLAPTLLAACCLLPARLPRARLLFRVGLPLMVLWTGRQVTPNSMALVQSFMCCLQDSPCATPREASLQDHMFEGFTYCSESFLAAAAAAGDAQLPAAAPSFGAATWQVASLSQNGYGSNTPSS